MKALAGPQPAPAKDVAASLPRPTSATVRPVECGSDACLGNLATQALLRGGAIRPKLEIGSVDDPSEREADAVADRVMRAPLDAGSCGAGCGRGDGILRRQPAEPGGGGRASSRHVEAGRLGLGAGARLPASLRSFFEPRFGREFGGVRVHTDGPAAAGARSIGARAYTLGNDIAFGEGHYRPETADGRQLIAHELAHVVQAGGAQRIRRAPDSATPQQPLSERYRAALEAERFEEAAVLLNGFNDTDIQARVDNDAELPPTKRRKLRLATPDWAHRVRRALLLRDYRDAVKSGNWTEAATHLNGFNDADIRLLASELGPAEVNAMMHGAREAMEGVSLYRVLGGLAARYRQVSDDPVGTKVIVVVDLMRAQGMPLAAAVAYVQLQLGVIVGPDTEPAQISIANAIGTLSAAMKNQAPAPAGGAASSGPIKAPKGQKAPPNPQPPHLEAGNLAHMLIGEVYASLNPGSLYDWSVLDILTLAKGRVSGLAKALSAAQRELFTNLDMRPDIIDLRRFEIFEIKPFGSVGLAVVEAKLYAMLFNALDLDQIHFTLGSPGNPGTSGMAPGPEEQVLVWASPVPGAIVYAFVRPPENPRSVQERLRSGAYEPGLGLGTEAVTGLALAGALAAAELLIVGEAVAVSYARLLPALVQAARQAGQAIPVIGELAGQ